MRRRVGWSAPGVLLAVVLFLAVVRLHPGGVKAGRAVDDVGQLLAAAAAAVACARRARRARCAGSGAGRSWLLLALATGSWACGEAAWSYFELLAGRQTPFPSVADAGYLLFAVLAVAGMLLWPSHALRGGGRWRGLLDGVLVAGSLFTITWVSALGSVVHAGGTGWFAFGVSLAYPVTDLVLLTLTVVVVAHARQASRSGLGLLAAGLGLLCLADSGFAYLTAAGSYATGSPVDAGWFGGFLLIAAAGCTATTSEQVDQPRSMESRTAALLPYLPAGLAVAVAVGDQLTGHGNAVALLAATLVMAALLARQLLAVLDNRRLVLALVDTQQALREFAILLEDGGDVTGVVAKILDGFTQPAAVGRDLVPLAASIGVVELSAGASSPHPAEFLQRADAAMYHAKRTGKARAVIWNEQLRPSRGAAAGAAAAPATAHRPA